MGWTPQGYRGLRPTKPQRKSKLNRAFGFEHCERRDLLAADLAFDITDGGATVEVGGTVSYAVTYQNRGDETATNSRISVELPSVTEFDPIASSAAWSCDGQQCSLDVGDVAAGDVGEATLAVGVSEDIPNELARVVVWGSIRSADSREFRLRNNFDWSVTPIQRPVHDLVLAITDNRARTMVGETVEYAIRYGNRAGTVANDATITAVLPEHTSFQAEASDGEWACEGQTCTLKVGSIEPGAGGESMIALQVEDTLPDDARQLVIWSEIDASSGIERNSRNNRDRSVTPVDRPTHDLRLAITDGGARTEAGGSVNYFIDYRNRGRNEALDAQIAVTLPANTAFDEANSVEGWVCDGASCTLPVGDLPAGSVGEAKIAVTVADELPADVRSLRIDAAITAGSGVDSNPRNNRDPSVTPVDRDYHNLRLRITDNGARVAAGETVTYDITYQNRSNHPAVGSTIAVELPEATTFSQDGSAAGWTCEERTCTLAVGDLAPGAGGSSAIALTLDSELPNDLSRLTVFAEIQASAGVDSNPRNNRDPSVTPIDRPYHDLRLDFIDRRATVSPGGSVAYFANYRNAGEHLANGVVLTVELPEHTTFDAAASSPGWACDGQLCTLTLGDVDPETGGEVTIAVQVDGELPEDLRRFEVLASIKAASGADSNTRNNQDPAFTPVVRAEPA